jgi:hypothetical protein
MSYDRPCFYLTYGGTLYPSSGGPEQWQTGMRFASDAAFGVDDFVRALDEISIVDILQDCTELITGALGVGLYWSSVVTIDWAKLAVLDLEGHYADTPIIAEQTPVPGGAGAFPFAPQLACVVSLWSGSTFGRANRGRSYLPPPWQWLDSAEVTDPRPTQAMCDSLRSQYRLWLSQVDGEVGTVALGVFPAIMSKIGTGTTKPISKIAVGRVIDTMRSRRQALEEEPSWANWP